MLYHLAVDNLADREVTLGLADRIPVSEVKDIRVSHVRIEPDVEPDKKGLIRWEITLPPRQRRHGRIRPARPPTG